MDMLPVFSALTEALAAGIKEVAQLKDRIIEAEESIRFWKAQYDTVVKHRDELSAKVLESHASGTVHFYGNDTEGILCDMMRDQFPNQKINAIKFIRGLTNCGLKEAKDWVEEHNAF